MRSVQLPVVNVTGCNRLKHVEQLTDLNQLYSVATYWIIIAILYDARSIEHK